MIGPLSAGVFNGIETGRAIFQFDPAAQTLQDLVRNFAQDPHRILALDFVGGVHKAVGEFAVVGEQHQAGGVQIQASHSDPSAPVQAWQ